jgi:hypothetical protein
VLFYSTVPRQVVIIWLTAHNPATSLEHRISFDGVGGRWTCTRYEDGDGSGLGRRGLLARIAFSCKPTSTIAKTSSTDRAKAPNSLNLAALPRVSIRSVSSTINASADVPKTPACFQARSSAKRLFCLAQPTPPRPDTRLALCAPKIQFSVCTRIRHSDTISRKLTTRAPIDHDALSLTALHVRTAPDLLLSQRLTVFQLLSNGF